MARTPRRLSSAGRRSWWCLSSTRSCPDSSSTSNSLRVVLSNCPSNMCTVKIIVAAIKCIALCQLPFFYPPPVPSGLPQQRRRRSGPARRERDRQRAARHQAAQGGAPPASPPPAASPVAPSTPEGLREAGRSNLDTLAISPTNEKREEVEDPPTPHLKHEQLSGHVEENEAPALVHCEHTYINSFTGLLEPEPCPLHPCCAMCEITAASEESRPPRFCNFQSDSSCPRPCSGDIFDVDTRRFGSDDWKVFNFIVGAPSLLEFRL